MLEQSQGKLELTYRIEPQVVALILLKSKLDRPMAELVMIKDWDDAKEQVLATSVFEDAVNLILNF